ncbi:hypothetical protein [Amycolatopsis sp. NPDC054798]
MLNDARDLRFAGGIAPDDRRICVGVVVRSSGSRTVSQARPIADVRAFFGDSLSETASSALTSAFVWLDKPAGGLRELLGAPSEQRRAVRINLVGGG